MGQNKEIEDRVRLRAEKGEFFEQLLMLSREASADIHEDFVRELTEVSVKLRQLFEKENIICRVNQPATVFWPAARGKRVAFIDGGILSLLLAISAFPVLLSVAAVLTFSAVQFVLYGPLYPWRLTV